MDSITKDDELLTEKYEAENFILRMLENPVHCNKKGRIKPEYLVNNLLAYMDWNEKQCKDIISGLIEEGIVESVNGDLCLHLECIYPSDCEEYPDQCASIMRHKHLNESIKQGFQVNW